MTSFQLLKPYTTSAILASLMILQVSACSTEGLSNSGNPSSSNIITDTSDKPLVGKTVVNQYLEEITPPICDTNNPAVQLIETNSDWDFINDADKKIFCVSPGNYSAVGNITLNSSGTIDSPRYIILNDGIDTHPGKLPFIENANVRFLFDNASYWVINRISTLDVFGSAKSNHPIRFANASHNNIINKYYINNCYYGINVGGQSHNNVIQNSRLSNQTLEGRLHDRVGIALNIQNGSDTVSIVKNTKIINNEIYNYNDGIQLVKDELPDGTWRPTNYEGTIIDSNSIYIDSNIYTDGLGNIDTNGDFAYAENAIDLKAGSENIFNPVVISNNHMWGYRESDKTNSGLGAHGTVLVAHFGVSNVIIENNFIFDSNRGINGNTLTNASVVGNTFYKIKDVYSYFYHTDNVLFSKNILTGENVAIWIKSNETTRNTTVAKNVIIDIPSHHGVYDDTNDVNNNYFYNVLKTPVEDLNSRFFSDASIAEHLDYSFITDKFTNSPREIILNKVITTENSPHFSIFN